MLRLSMVCFLSFAALLVPAGNLCRTVWAGSNLWTNVGPDGGVVDSFAIASQNSNIIYAGTFGGVFKSMDGGANWGAASSGLPIHSYAGSFAIDPQNPGKAYVALGGVFKTTDGGTNWSNSLPPGFSARALAIDTRDPSTLYAGTFGNGIFKTTDAGSTWREDDSGLGHPNAVYSLAVDPQDPNTVYAATNLGLFKRTDGGTNWNLTGNPDIVHFVAIDPRTGTLYANGSALGLFKSADGGANWSAAGVGLPNGFAISLAIDPQNPAVLYAATTSGIFNSEDGGNNWTRKAELIVNKLAMDPQRSSTLYASGLQSVGILKSTDGGASWREANSGLAATEVSALAIDPQDAGTIYGVVQHVLSNGVVGQVLLRGQVGARSWSDTGLSIRDVSSLAIDSQDSSTLYVGTAHGVFKSTDRGENWNAVNSGLPVQPLGTLVNTVVIDPSNANTVYAGVWPVVDGFGVFKSTDGGTTWSASGSGLPKNFAVLSLVIDPQNPSTLYALTYAEFDEISDVDRGLSKSTDGGASWKPVNFGLPTGPYGHTYVYSLAIDPKNSSTLYAGTGSGVFKSTDGAANWSAASSGLPSNVADALAIDPQNSNTVYVGTFSGVFRTTDGGASWNAVNSGLTMPDVHTLVVDPHDPEKLYAGTSGGGVFTTNFVPDSAVTELRFDRTTITAGLSYVATVSGSNLTAQTFFDVRFRVPGSTLDQEALNWQIGTSGSHMVALGTATGSWTLTGVRPHEIETDHTGSFFPVSATITIAP